VSASLRCPQFTRKSPVAGMGERILTGGAHDHLAHQLCNLPNH
jgi:hypothetical protein